jgi:ribonuclease HI
VLKQDDRIIVLYTDGSILNENFGAGTVVDMTGAEVIDVIYAMGHQQEIYDTELLGIHTAIQQCCQICEYNNLTKRHIWIFTDNPAAITWLNTLKPGPWRSNSLAFSNMSNNIHALKSTIIVQWIPGHTDIPGNELANMLVQKSTLEKPPAH